MEDVKKDEQADLSSINNATRSLRYKIYSEVEEICANKFPKSRACFDLNNSDVDLKTCKLVLVEYTKCCKELMKEQMKSKGIMGIRP